MKKALPQIVLLLLIYFGIFFTVGDWNPNMLKAQLTMGWNSPDQIPENSQAAKIIRDIRSDSTKMKWEYIKSRLFIEGNPKFSKLEDTVDVHCDNATLEDSLAISNTIIEINDVVPDLYLRYEQNKEDDKTKSKRFGSAYTFSPNFINLSFFDFNKFESKTSDVKYPNGSITLDGKSFMYHNNSRIGTIDFNLINNHIYFYLEEELNKNLRTKCVRYAIFRSLCAVQQNGIYPNGYYNQGGAYSFYSSASYFPDNSVLTNNDIFLIKRLYSEDFREDFADYMYDTYPWRYAINFLNEDKAKVTAILIICLLAIGILILAFFTFYKRNFKYPILSYILPFLTFWMFYVVLNWFYGYLTDMNFSHGYGTNLIFLLFSIGVSAISGTVLYYLEKLSFVRNNFTLGLLLKILFTCLVFIAPLMFIVLSKNEDWDKLLTPEFFISFIIPVVILSLGRGVLIYLNHYSENLVKEKDLELSALREANTNSQLRLLQAQINPHFLYNSLNSIAGLAHKDADKTEQMALSLSDLFRYTVGQKNQNTSTVSEEMEMVKRYLEIEKIRFGDRLDYEIFIEKNLEAIEIPRFILQPLVENSIKHGVSKLEEQGNIRITAQSNNDKLTFVIEDNGSDFPEGLLSGHGLQSIYDLLKLHYDDAASLNWKNSPVKQIEIKVPKKMKQ